MAKQTRAVFARRRRTVRGVSNRRTVSPVELKFETGFEPAAWPREVRTLRTDQYRVDNREVGGDAPKDFIWVRNCLPSRKGGSRDIWTGFVAKVGHKMYPSESITEHLTTRVGQVLGFKMAESSLMVCAGQVRFMSRYFLQPQEILNHGAEILVGYLEDKQFVEGVVDQRAEKDLFTFQVFCTAIRQRFPSHAEKLLRGFVGMIAFDALVGNQDRHFYNWGVITHATGATEPRFAPIYDTARGLFWNAFESELHQHADSQSLEAYIRRSKPQIGWDGWKKKDLSHFDLIEGIAGLDSSYLALLEQVGKVALGGMDRCCGMIDAEFGKTMSEDRLNLIKRCLRLRAAEFAKIF